MKKNITIFEQIKTIDKNNNEFWEARKLAKTVNKGLQTISLNSTRWLR